MEYYHSKQKSSLAHIRYSLPPFYWHASSPVQPMTAFLHFRCLCTAGKSGCHLCNLSPLRGRYPQPAYECYTPSHHQPFGRQKNHEFHMARPAGKQEKKTVQNSRTTTNRHSKPATTLFIRHTSFVPNNRAINDEGNVGVKVLARPFYVFSIRGEEENAVIILAVAAIHVSQPLVIRPVFSA